MAETPEETLRRRRRRRLLRGLLVGAAAIGLPALANATLARRARRLATPQWGEPKRWAWSHGRVAYRRLGDGRPIVLIHSIGPGHSSLEWRRTAELLSADYTVYVPDLLGWGESSRPPLRYDWPLYRELIGDFLTDVVGGPAVVGGAGISAAYALHAAVEHPGLVRSLLLVTPQGVELERDGPELRDRLLHGLLQLPVLGVSALNFFSGRAALERYLRREIYYNGERVDAALVESHYRGAHLPGSHAPLAAHLAGYLSPSVEAILPEVAAPVWLAWGREAVSPAVAAADLWLARLPSAQLEVFAGAAALPHAEVPKPFVVALTRFLAGRSS